MAMTLKFGGTTFRVGSVGVVSHSELELDSTGVAWLEHRRYDLAIRLVHDVGSTVNAQAAAIRTAFRTPATSLELRYPDNSLSEDSLAAGSTIGGVRCVSGPHYVSAVGGQRVTSLDLTATVEATIPLFTDPYYIIDFREQTPIRLTGQKLAVLQPNIGPAIIQQVRNQEHCVFSQSGEVVYAGAYGAVPNPLFPGTVQLGRRETVYATPRKIGRAPLTGFVGFPIQYTYQFAAPFDLVGLPQSWVS